MKIDLRVLDSKILADLKMVGVTAHRLGFAAYLVGGVVRDVLLKRPSCDWDIVVEGDAIALGQSLVDKAKSRIVAYPQFGTATIHFHNRMTMDLVSARSEHYPHPGALPVVKKGTIKEDLFRRDFTINALAVALNPDSFGQLQDFYGGYDDLQNKRVRVLHEKSFVDDPTRILRAVRFAARLGFRLETKTLQYFKQAVDKKMPATVKMPRYFAEFRKIFSEEKPVECLRNLAALGGLDFIAPRFRPDWKFLGHVEKRVLKLKKEKFYASKDWSKVFLLGFFARVNPDEIKHFAKTFHLTKEEQMRLSELSQVPDIIGKLKVAALMPSQIYEILDPVDLEIIYFILAGTSVNMVAFNLEQFLQKWRLVSLEITGKDLQDLGLPPGRKMGALLHTLLLHKIDGKIKNHHDEIALAKHFVFSV